MTTVAQICGSTTQESSYGLKQSPSCRNKHSTDSMNTCRFTENTANSCLFYRISDNNKSLVALCVDDGLVAATNENIIQELFNTLKSEFRIIIEPMSGFLNILINRINEKCITISQKEYTEDIIQRFEMCHAMSASTPTKVFSY